MREIKFRQFCSDEDSHQYGMHFYDPYQRTLVKDGDWHTMQFTGLKDKAGREIYEGDILFVGNPIPCKCCTATKTPPKVQVIWEEGAGWYLTGECGGALWANTPHEIIGNMYENPELLSQNVRS